MILAFNKPFRVLSQFTPEPGSAHDTLASFGFPADVYPLGRLDADSEGLLLLSDVKGLNKALLDPTAAHKRTYLVQVEGAITEEALMRLQRGIAIRIPSASKSQGATDVFYTTLPCVVRAVDPPVIPDRIPPIRSRKSIPTSWIELELIEGKNRQVRRMLAAVGFPVLRLLRVRIGDLALGDLAVGSWRELDARESGLLLR